jgi:hypothetical protein
MGCKFHEYSDDDLKRFADRIADILEDRLRHSNYINTH